MRKYLLLILAGTLLSIICRGQKIDNLKLTGSGEVVHQIEFSKDGGLLVLNNNRQIRVIDTDSIAKYFSLSIGATSMAVSESSKLVAFGTSDGELHLYDNLQKVNVLKAHKNQIFKIAFSGSDKFMASAGLDSTVRIWSTQTFELLQHIEIKEGLLTDLKFSLDEEFLVSSHSTGNISVWSLKDNRLSATHKLTNHWIRSIAISPDSARYAVCSDDKRITILSFKEKPYYQLTKSHKNIITNIKFLNKDYILSIGHDNRVVMSNINIPVELDVLHFFDGYARYSGKLYDMTGDKYLSDLAVSNEKRITAVSSYGNGIAITDYFHNLIDNPHEVSIISIDNLFVESNFSDTEFAVAKNICVIKGIITRPAQIRNAWIHYIKDDKMVKLKLNKSGEFHQQIGVFGEFYDYSIIVEDWDSNLKKVEFNFRLILTE